MRTQTFPCPFCGKRMGVPVELLGRHVRCPHCKQIGLAPSPAPDAPAAETASVAAPDDLPTFHLPKTEAAESIFSEHDTSDELFQSAKRTRIDIPDLLAEAVSSDPPPPVAAEATPPVLVPYPVPDDPDPSPPVPTYPVEKRPAAPLLAPAERDAPPTGGAGRSLTAGFFLLLAYALVVTGLAVYGLFLKPTGTVPPGHPLSLIPDNFGGFDPAKRKDPSQAAAPLDGPLPPELKVALGGKLQVGQVEVEPLSVEARGLHVVLEPKNGARKEERFPGRALVLTLRVKNTSDDLLLYPMDPAFTRRHAAGSRAPHPGTGLVAGKETFWGGEIEWPVRLPAVRREYEIAQKDDATPLGPGESRDYVVFTDPKAHADRAVQSVADGLLWRVQVRRGLVEYRGKEVPVTAIVGVEFTPADVR